MSREHLRLLLSGLAAGDSLGSTSEFVHQSRIPDVYARYAPEGWPFKQVGGGTFRWQPGEPTDDSEMAMAMVRSYLERGHFDPAHVAEQFVAWMKRGPKDIGGTTRRTLSRIAAGTPWHEGGLEDFRRNPANAANGSLMRNGIVLGLADSLDEAFEISLAHGVMTHYAPLPVLCCAAQTWIICRLLEGDALLEGGWLHWFEDDFQEWLGNTKTEFVNVWLNNVSDGSGLTALDEAWETLRAAEFHPDRFNPFETDFSIGQGYCLLTLQIGVWAAAWAQRESPFPNVPKGFPSEPFVRAGPWALSWVAMIGHDSDTYGATAGPIIAAACGEIPSELTERLWIMEKLATLP